jgi:hypothetical protein
MRGSLLFIVDLPRLAAFTTAVSLLPSLLSPKHPQAMAGYGDGAANNGFGWRSLHQWEGRLLYMAGYPALPFRHVEHRVLSLVYVSLWPNSNIL